MPARDALAFDSVILCTRLSNMNGKTGKSQGEGIKGKW